MHRAPSCLAAARSPAAIAAAARASAAAARRHFTRAASAAPAATATTISRRGLSPACARRAAAAGQRRHATLRHKVVPVEDAMGIVKSGCTVGVGGFVAQNAPEALLRALGERFEKKNEPRDLTVFFGGGPGDYDNKGLSHLGKKGLLKRSIGAHYGQCPRLAELVLANEVEAYNLPLGAISRMLRTQASHQPGYVTTVGTNTVVDPEVGNGGKLNERTTEDLVVPLVIEGTRYLMFKSQPIDVAFIRGTTADANGNVSMERESLYADNLALAMAAKNSGGFVIAQVERIADRGTIPSRNVHIPGSLVDAVVVAAPEEHPQSYVAEEYNPFWSGEIKSPEEDLVRLPHNVRKVIARRAAMELRVDDVVNLGIGMPDAVANVAQEENILKFVTLTAEPGVFGGIGATGKNFGPASNYEAIVNMDQQFDFYNGGGLNICFLGMAQVSPMGDVNVTRFGKKLAGPGGFMDISQCTKSVVFMGSFTAGGLEMDIDSDKREIRVVQEGRAKKFTQKLVETSFSALSAVEQKQRVLYVTERCVFRLTPEGLELLEVAPGIDVEKDILAHMDFVPLGAETARTMDPRIFDGKSPRMGLKKDLTEYSYEERISYNTETNTMLMDLSGVVVLHQQQIDEAREAITKRFEDIGKKVHVVVNYDRFDCRKSLVDEWTSMASKLQEKYYLSVQRCINTSFLRAKVQHGLKVETGGATKVFDELDSDGSGFITYDQCKELFQKVGRLVSDEALLDSSISEVDVHKRGRLTFSDIQEVDKILARA